MDTPSPLLALAPSDHDWTEIPREIEQKPIPSFSALSALHICIFLVVPHGSRNGYSHQILKKNVKKKLAIAKKYEFWLS